MVPLPFTARLLPRPRNEALKVAVLPACGASVVGAIRTVGRLVAKLFARPTLPCSASSCVNVWTEVGLKSEGAKPA
jgi:hypothetical protein